MREEPYAILQLLRHGKCWFAIVGVEGLVVAISASSHTFISITVGACETCIHGNLLNLVVEVLGQEGGKIIIWAMCYLHTAKIRISEREISSLLEYFSMRAQVSS